MPDPATSIVDLIRAKRDGHALTDDEIRWLIAAYTGGAVADEQMSALLMAVYFQGLSPGELRAWTAAMVSSGERLDLSAVPAPTVDKHSTGGVGDKVSLVLAPLVASCGAVVPQLSGRGLGHTGGTLDKLESIPGWRAGLSTAEMIAVLRSAGCVICAAGSGLAPADRRLYALRDVTGTVESIPLIASSIMSKKIAEGTAALVLDVKVGSGAFMREMPAARLLAQTMAGLGAEAGVRTTALLTQMDAPLGRAVGNAVEVVVQQYLGHAADLIQGHHAFHCHRPAGRGYAVMRSITSGPAAGGSGPTSTALLRTSIAAANRVSSSPRSSSTGWPAVTWSPGLARQMTPAAWFTSSSLRARPAPSRQAATPTARASSRRSQPACAAVTTWLCRARGSGASGSPPWAAIISR